MIRRSQDNFSVIRRPERRKERTSRYNTHVTLPATGPMGIGPDGKMSVFMPTHICYELTRSTT
ncbi:hypothetical protein D3OALGA1CA_3617 [Olavius algarvensis associated proteobacterium Delta 3]|nr:hypothetical protein D3OALGA1CA_3617 [Olavius algarvensis associated proteobacterium Delta 3]CAB5147229.1 hypothetical protein D3OALGB2SA_4579 [Olavius algarvensis associated proteobacterium Delta 3]